MKALRTTNRRSFLAAVAGGGAVAGAALTLVLGPEARAQNSRYTGVTDCDTGSRADRPGYGTGDRNQHTDSDTGPNADARCHGRGSNSGADTGTQYNPTTNPNSGCSDQDYGPEGDPGGHGRACRGREANPYAPQVSGCTDRDTGNGSDSIGNGRHCTPQPR